jgi:uncharacterized protein (UPF0303 family)
MSSRARGSLSATSTVDDAASEVTAGLDPDRNSQGEEGALIFSSFTNDDAWALGHDMRNAAREAQLPVCIDIRRANGTELFHVSLIGATVDNDEWARKKAAVVLRFEESSARFGERYAAAPAHPALAAWVDMNRFAPVGGAFPVRVIGAGVVAAVSVSGLAGDGDHEFVVSAIRAFLTRTAQVAAAAEIRTTKVGHNAG